MRSDWLALGVGVAVFGAGALGSLWPRAEPHVVWASATASTHTLDLAPWLPDRAELLDPRTRLPHTHQFDATALRAALSGDLVSHDAALKKLSIWQRHEDGGPLPEDFFDHPPWMHPMGRSYSAMAGRTDHLHIQENPEGPLADTTDATRIALVRGHRDIVGPRWVFLSESADRVRMLPRSLFDLRLDRAGYRWTDCAPSPRCMIPTTRGWARRALAIGSLWSTASLAILVLLHRRRQRQHAESQAFMLRTLTHELRTPATAIGLHLDGLRRSFDALPQEAQDAFLGLAAANQSLRRTLDATGTFLTVQRGAVPLERTPIPIHELDLGVPTTGEATLHTDRRWLTLALGNLVSNAEQHGAAPIEVFIEPHKDEVRITVQDAGQLDAPLDTLTEPFERGSQSDGLGLGLALTQRIATLLHGRLTVAHQPTRFTLHLRDLP